MTAPTLHLHLKAEYFDAIKRGEKTEEFRLFSTWNGKLKTSYDKIILYRGYPKAGDHDKRMERPWRGWTLKTITHKHFGPEPVLVYAIRVNP